MKVPLDTCLLLALLSAVGALRCKTCFGCGKKCREEDTKTVECAPDQDTCVAVSANFTVYDFPFAFTYKGCSKSQECLSLYHTGSAVPNRYGQVKSHCCQTDECNVQDPQLPDRSSLRPNGVECPGFISTSDYCYGQETVQCVGIENQCFEIMFDLSPYGLPAKQINAKGCGNQELCSSPTGPVNLGNGVLKYNFYDLHCYSGQGSCKLQQKKW